MRLAEILTILKTAPLLASNDYRGVLLELLNEHMEMDRAEFQNKRTGMAKSGDELDVEQPEVLDNGLALIPVGGPLAIKLGEFEKGAGCVDMNDLAKEVREADDNDDVLAICLNFDSPGGTYQGCFETAKVIAAAQKKTIAFVSGQCCSGAFALACACDIIIATPSATMGNVGVYTVYHDMSEAARLKGIKVKVFSSGAIKGFGVPGTSLSAEQEIFILNDVLEKAANFQAHVQSHRSDISTEDMQGQFYCGETALKKGFVDQLVNSMDEMIASLVESGDILEVEE